MPPQQNITPQQPAAAPTPPVTPGPTPPAAPKSKALAITGFVLSLIALLSAVTGFIGVIISLVAIGLTVTALIKKQPRILSTIGLVFSVFSFIAALMIALAYMPSSLGGEAHPPSNTFKAYSQGLISFEYPDNWTTDKVTDNSVSLSPISSFELGEEIGGESYIYNRLLYDYAIPAKLGITEQQRQDFASKIQADPAGALELAQSYTACDQAKSVGAEPFKADGLIGTTVEYECKSTSDRSPVHGYFISAKDNVGIQYNFTMFSTSRADWEANQSAFQKIISSIKWKNTTQQ